MVDTRYRRSAGCVYTLKYHFVWCPRYRRGLLVDSVAERLEQLLDEKAAELGAQILALEIQPDHVHLFVESDPALAPAHIAAQFKGYTSRVLRQEFPYLKSRFPALWSRSYYVGAVGHVSEATVRSYIEGQKAS